MIKKFNDVYTRVKYNRGYREICTLADKKMRDCKS